jgi:O-antigen ligase
MLGYWVLIISVITGQITRIGNLGVLTDLLIPFYLGYWLLTRDKKRPLPFSKSILLVVVWLFYLLGNLLINLNFIPAVGGEIGAILYWVRLASYMSLLLPLIDYRSQNPERVDNQLWYMVFVSSVILSILGFAQLVLFPDFSFMAQYGWDPHQGRLLSTWYDPNFLGGFLGLASVIILSRVLVFLKENKSWQKQNIILLSAWIIGLGVVLGALILTYSRSALLAFLIGVTIVTILISRRTFVLVLISLSIIVISNPRLQTRIQGAIQVDVTASLRIQSWRETLDDIDKNPIWGIGYNTIKYQTIVPSELNSASGRDSSLLTLWLTGGIIGLGIFLIIIFNSIIKAFHKISKSGLERVWGVVIIAGWALILVHSMFVNSIFFPHILIFILFFLL